MCFGPNTPPLAHVTCAPTGLIVVLKVEYLVIYLMDFTKTTALFRQLIFPALYRIKAKRSIYTFSRQPTVVVL